MKAMIIPMLLGSLLAGCAIGPQINTGIGANPPSAYGWNIGAADLLDPATAPCRIGVYLDELTAQGYAKQIRIIYTPDWGPQILRDWMPVFRAKRFRMLVIVSQDGRGGHHGGDYGDDSEVGDQAEWIAKALPPILDLLDGVQPSNEPDEFSGKSPGEFAAWFRKIATMIRETVPGVPIVGPDLRKSETGWVARTGLVYGQDYDIVNLHVTHMDTVSELEKIKASALAAHPQPRVWITEGDWGQAPWYGAHGLPIERTYIYVWNGREPESRRPGGAIPCGG